MKIKIENKNYILDVKKAQELGVLKEKPSITKIQAGDVFQDPTAPQHKLIVASFTDSRDDGKFKFIILGLGRKFNAFCCDSGYAQEEHELIKYLNNLNWDYVTNINLSNINYENS